MWPNGQLGETCINCKFQSFPSSHDFRFLAINYRRAKAFSQAMISASSLSTTEGPPADITAITYPLSFWTIALIPISLRSANNAASKLSLNREDGGGHHTSIDTVGFGINICIWDCRYSPKTSLAQWFQSTGHLELPTMNHHISLKPNNHADRKSVV